MSFAPFNFLNLFSLSAFKGLNWFEGLKRIKIFLQWAWGVPAGLILIIVLLFFHLSGGESLMALAAFALPIIGVELLFRAVVWIVAGFLQAGDAKNEALKLGQAHQPDEVKKKITTLFSTWISDLKNTKTHQVIWAIFFLLWLYIWIELVTKTGLCPISHWRDSGFSYPLNKLSTPDALKLIWYVIVTLLRTFLAILVLFYVYAIYSSVEELVLKKLKARDRS